MKIIKQYETQKCMANVLFQQSQQTQSWLEPTQSAKVLFTNCETERSNEIAYIWKNAIDKIQK